MAGKLPGLIVYKPNKTVDTVSFILVFELQKASERVISIYKLWYVLFTRSFLCCIQAFSMI